MVLPPHRHSGEGRSPGRGCGEPPRNTEVQYLKFLDSLRSLGMTMTALVASYFHGNYPCPLLTTYEDENGTTSLPSLPLSWESTPNPWIPACNRMTDEVSVGDG